MQTGELQGFCIPHLFTIYIAESTHYENEAASLIHCNIYIYITYVRLPLRRHLPCRILSVERQISSCSPMCVSFALIFIKLIYFICMLRYVHTKLENVFLVIV